MSEIKKTFKAKPEPEATKASRLRAVHGLMINPFTQVRFEMGAVTEVQQIDAWTEMQIRAGKLAHVAE